MGLLQFNSVYVLHEPILLKEIPEKNCFIWHGPFPVMAHWPGWQISALMHLLLWPPTLHYTNHIVRTMATAIHQP